MSYQHIDPELVGNETRILVSELSGKDNIAYKTRGVWSGRAEPGSRSGRCSSQIKELENAGFAFESAEASVDLMLRRTRRGLRRAV